MGEFVPGTMNIEEQKRTFSGFVKAGVWLSVVVAVVLVFLALFRI